MSHTHMLYLCLKSCQQRTLPQDTCRLYVAVALRLCLIVLWAQPLGELLHLRCSIAW